MHVDDKRTYQETVTFDSLELGSVFEFTATEYSPKKFYLKTTKIYNKDGGIVTNAVDIETGVSVIFGLDEFVRPVNAHMTILD